MHRYWGWTALVGGVVVWFGAWLIGGSEEVEVPPIRRCHDRTLPPALIDVLSRLSIEDERAAQSPDGCPITTAHEGTHFLNSRLSRPGVRGFYMLDGDAARLTIPKNTKLAHVADAIPAKHRGQTYRTYLIDAQRDWNDISIYLLDEAASYINGCITRMELGWERRQETDRFAIELLVYSKYAMQEIERRDRDYPVKELRDLLDLFVARARLVIKDFDEQPYAEALAGLGVELYERVMAEDVADAE